MKLVFSGLLMSLFGGALARGCNIREETESALSLSPSLKDCSFYVTSNLTNRTDEKQLSKHKSTPHYLTHEIKHNILNIFYTEVSSILPVA